MEEKKSRLRISSVVVNIIANLIPLAGVLFFDWKVFDILVIYWTETGIIFICGVIKLVQEGRLMDREHLSFLPVAATFAFMGGHYLFLYMAGIFMHEIHTGGGTVTLLEPFTQQPSIWASILAILAGRIQSLGILPRKPAPEIPGFNELFAALLVPRIMIQAAVILIAFGMGVTGANRFFLAVAALVLIKIVLDLLDLRRKNRVKDETGKSQAGN